MWCKCVRLLRKYVADGGHGKTNGGGNKSTEWKQQSWEFQGIAMRVIRCSAHQGHASCVLGTHLACGPARPDQA